MTQAALLVDCHKIISSFMNIQPGFKIVRNFPKIGIMLVRRLKKRLKYCSKIVVNLEAIKPKIYKIISTKMKVVRNI